MSAPSTLTELKDAIVERLEALDASAHALIGSADPSTTRWVLSRVPLDVMAASGLAQHLAFSVLVQSAPATGAYDLDEETVQIRPVIRIAYVYRMSTGDLDAGHDAAMTAAHDLVRGLLGDETWTYGRTSIDLLDAFTPGAVYEDVWLEASITIAACLDLPFSPAPVRR